MTLLLVLGTKHEIPEQLVTTPDQATPPMTMSQDLTPFQLNHLSFRCVHKIDFGIRTKPTFCPMGRSSGGCNECGCHKNQRRTCRMGRIDIFNLNFIRIIILFTKIHTWRNDKMRSNIYGFFCCCCCCPPPCPLLGHGRAWNFLYRLDPFLVFHQPCVRVWFRFYASHYVACLPHFYYPRRHVASQAVRPEPLPNINLIMVIFFVFNMKECIII